MRRGADTVGEGMRFGALASWARTLADHSADSLFVAALRCLRGATSSTPNQIHERVAGWWRTGRHLWVTPRGRETPQSSAKGRLICAPRHPRFRLATN